MTWLIHTRRETSIRPDLNMKIMVRDVLRLVPTGRYLDMACLVDDVADIPSIPKNVWYYAHYRKKPLGQIIWKKAHADVRNNG